MKRVRMLIAGLLAVMLAVTAAGCGAAGSGSAQSAGSSEEQQETALVVGYDGKLAFGRKFSPFFAESTFNSDVAAMTGITLLNSDRAGAVVCHGIEGETIPYHGTDYTYYGPADMEVTEQEDGTVTYDVTLREDLTFSDGVPVTIDDVIFSLYVYCDPSYDGPSTLCSAPIQGLEEYRQNSVALSLLLAQLGEDNQDFTLVTREQQTAFWDAVNTGLVSFAQALMDQYQSENALTSCTPSETANYWGIELEENATVKDFALALGDHYAWDFGKMQSRFETTGLASQIPQASDCIPEEVYQYSYTSVFTGDSAPNIAGIQKTGAYSLRVVAEWVDVGLLYQLGSVVIAPMHYYGDESLYDYEQNSFGFAKGDLRYVMSKMDHPMGAGPYQYVEYEGGEVLFEANPSYYLGEPKTEHIIFRVLSEADMWEMEEGPLSGTLDISYLNSGWGMMDEIWAAEGDKVTIDPSDSWSYTYIGLNPQKVNVGGDPGSEASKYLRRAFCTIFGVYRSAVIGQYPNFESIQQPCSNTFWISADQETQAFSKDLNGTELYTADMTEAQRYEAAANAALDYLEAAGYTVSGGKVTSAPEGASLTYEIQVSVVYKEKDPLYQILAESQKALAELGITLNIQNVFNVDADKLVDVGNCEMWGSNWNDIDIHSLLWTEFKWVEWYYLSDPDQALYEIYYSDAANGGSNAGIYTNVYHIADPELDNLILEARSTVDQDARKAIYQDCLNLIEDWACEVPVYQDQAHTLFSNQRINPETIPPDLTTAYGWMREAHQIALK